MSDEKGKGLEIGGLMDAVPSVHYDLIARILPGMALWLSILVARGHDEQEPIVTFANESPGISLLILLALSYITGILLTGFSPIWDGISIAALGRFSDIRKNIGLRQKPSRVEKMLWESWTGGVSEIARMDGGIYAAEELWEKWDALMQKVTAGKDKLLTQKSGASSALVKTVPDEIKTSKLWHTWIRFSEPVITARQKNNSAIFWPAFGELVVKLEGARAELGPTFWSAWKEYSIKIDAVAKANESAGKLLVKVMAEVTLCENLLTGLIIFGAIDLIDHKFANGDILFGQIAACWHRWGFIGAFVAITSAMAFRQAMFLGRVVDLYSLYVDKNTSITAAPAKQAS